MEKKNKKLQLNKETIRNLSDESLGQVAGGGKKGDSDALVCISFVNKTACINVNGCHSQKTCAVVGCVSNYSCLC